MQLQKDMVRKIISQYGETSVYANQFFVSWHSVVTLAYSGFSRTLLAVKRGIEEGIPGLKCQGIWVNLNIENCTLNINSQFSMLKYKKTPKGTFNFSS